MTRDVTSRSCRSVLRSGGVLIRRLGVTVPLCPRLGCTGVTSITGVGSFPSFFAGDFVRKFWEEAVNTVVLNDKVKSENTSAEDLVTR